MHMAHGAVYCLVIIIIIIGDGHIIYTLKLHYNYNDYSYKGLELTLFGICIDINITTLFIVNFIWLHKYIRMLLNHVYT